MYKQISGFVDLNPAEGTRTENISHKVTCNFFNDYYL